MTSTNTAADGKPPVEPQIVGLRRLNRVVYEVPIIGTAPLITNRWSEKARQMMLDKQTTSVRSKKPPKDPVELFEAAKYTLPDGRCGMPASAFKAAIVHAARLVAGITQVQLKQTIRVLGELDDRGEQIVPITYDQVIMREDTPRNASGVADLRYRPQYNGWRAVLPVQIIEGQVDEGSLLALVDAAGVGGVGEMRPTAPKSATGQYGTFEIDDTNLMDILS